MTMVSRWHAGLRRRVGLLALMLPGAALLFVGLAMPLFEVVKDSLSLPGLSWDAYISVFNDELVTDAVIRTFAISGIVTVLSIVGGYVIALTAWRSTPTWAVVILLIASFPVLTSLVTRNFAWLIFLGRTGPLNDLLIGVGVVDEPIHVLNSSTAIVIGMFHVMLPFAVLPTYNALRKIDPVLLKASAAFGASSFKTFRKVVLPLSAPGGVVATVFVFVLSLGFFITPALLGGPTNSMIANVVDKEANFYLDFARASAIAVLLLVSVAVLVAAVAKYTNVTKVFRG